MGKPKPAGGRKGTGRVAPARAREDADKGVRECLDLMTSGRWISGKSHTDLAAKHGVSPETVKNWATNASRIIRLATEGDREDIRARMLATLDTVVAMALQKEAVLTFRDRDPEVIPQPDLKAAVSALSEQGKLLGLVTSKVDVTSKPSVAGLSREEHLAALEQLKAEIAEEEARLADEVAIATLKEAG